MNFIEHKFDHSNPDVKENDMCARAGLARLSAVLVLLFALGAAAGLGPKQAGAMDSIAAVDLRAMVEQARGKVVLVNFWASWCGPCRMEMPHLVKLRQSLGGEDLLMIGVSVDFDADAAANYADQAGLNYPTFHALEEVMPAFAVEAIPKTMVWDRDGRLRIEHVGLMDSKALKDGVGNLVRP